ncbi:hypothetical protein ACFOEK_19845 [Litoribrevibacter euphylliae]|uniref:Sel1 repeat family protein n=1 Tax=Litoribrevibacter euphylliae TaxID=1834034 RepID=A0ABV7HHH0_9GAMM
MIKKNTRRLLLLLISVALSSAAYSDVMGMTDIRYQLHQDDQANLEADIRILAEAGSSSAQVMLADVLAENSNVESLKEASYWYQQSYQKGRGVIRSITSLARLSDQYDWLTDLNQQFYSNLNESFFFEKNAQTVIAGLEIFVTYPELFSETRIDQLISLHDGVCIEDCQGKLYKAVSLAFFESMDAAEPFFVDASKDSTRAIRIYFDSLPEEGKFTRFSQFANQLKKDIDSVDTASKLSIANRLRSLSEEFNQEVIFWLDQAIDGGYQEAYSVRAEYMLSFPLNFSYPETQKIIQQVSATEPQKGQLLEASLYIVREWKKLQPDKAYGILAKLDSEGVLEATIGLGDLYSMGGLDQVDQPQAIKTYLRAAERGSPVGYQKIANIYRGGRGIVNDKSKAFGYSKLASYLGNDASDVFLESLTKEMQLEELNAGEEAYQKYLSLYVLREGASL